MCYVIRHIWWRQGEVVCSRGLTERVLHQALTTLITGATEIGAVFSLGFVLLPTWTLRAGLKEWAFQNLPCPTVAWVGPAVLIR